MPNLTTQEILSELVAFDTTSRQSNLALISYIEGYLADFGIKAQRIADPHSDNRCNLYATIGRDDVGGVLLSGHTDVVPVKGQQWSDDPYRLYQRDGLLYGRGSSDMKGFIAACLAALPQWSQQKLTTPIHLGLSFDEEIGCVGVKHMVDWLQNCEVKPRLAVIGEPTEMAQINAHKGKRAYQVNFTGLAGHSAYINDGVNAVHYAAELVSYLSACNAAAKARCEDAGYSVTHSTFHVGKFNGGVALNIIPADCELHFEIRHLPQDDIDVIVKDIKNFAQQELLPAMQRVNPAAAISFKALANYPGLKTPADAPIMSTIRQFNPTAGQSGQVSFGTEAGIFQRDLAIPALVCGPGSIAQAHKPDEFIALSELALCDDFMRHLGQGCEQGIDV